MKFRRVRTGSGTISFGQQRIHLTLKSFSFRDKEHFEFFHAISFGSTYQYHHVLFAFGSRIELCTVALMSILSRSPIVQLINLRHRGTSCRLIDGFRFHSLSGYHMREGTSVGNRPHFGNVRLISPRSAGRSFVQISPLD